MLLNLIAILLKFAVGNQCEDISSYNTLLLVLTTTTESPMTGHGRGHFFFLKMAMGHGTARTIGAEF